MKKSIKLTLMLSLLVAMLLIPNIISANTESKILKKSDKYLIYNENAMNIEGNLIFALGQENQSEDSLIYFPLGKDSTEAGAKNIAYIDETTSPYLNENSEAFLFIKKEGASDYIVRGEKISLSDAIDKELVETTTERIGVDTNQKHTITTQIDGVETQVTRGKIVITDDQNAKYSFAIMSVPANDSTSSYYQLVDLAMQLSNKKALEELTFMQKLELMSKFNKLYNEIKPDIDDNDAWQPVEKEILQPENSKEGDKYIVFIKKEAAGEETIIDAQFLVCDDDYTPLYEKETITIKETSKLPVTFDSTITLIAILAVIVVAIIIVLIIRKKVDKKEENK